MTTLIQFILNEERKILQASGNFTLLLTCIEDAAKIIASKVRQNGLIDIVGATGEKNSYNEEIQKLDQISNDILIKILSKSGQACVLASEELAEPIYLDNNGDYIVFFDPLDGSSLIETSGVIGTIFSIYKKDGDNILQAGKKQVAAGYIVYGSNTMFVYTSGQGVNGFTFDASIGSFLLSHPNIQIPESKKIYSINEGYSNLYGAKLQNYLKLLKEDSYKLRYIGSAVGDIHRTLLQGGIFLYPADSKNPGGKERLMFEANPLAFIVEQAGGASYSGDGITLDIQPKSIEDQVPLVLGSKKEVEKYLRE